MQLLRRQQPVWKTVYQPPICNCIATHERRERGDTAPRDGALLEDPKVLGNEPRMMRHRAKLSAGVGEVPNVAASLVGRKRPAHRRQRFQIRGPPRLSEAGEQSGSREEPLSLKRE